MAKAPMPRAPQDMQHYVIWHPEKSRDRIKPKSARAFVRNGPGQFNPIAYHGQIWVDNHPTMVGRDKCCNEDPWVLSDRWLYSYCHAHTLRRSDRYREYVKRGSVLFFASGEEWYDHDRLVIDTVFVVRDRHVWIPPGQVPRALSLSYPPGTKEYDRHLTYGTTGGGGKHTGKYTYEAELQPPRLEIDPSAEQNTRYSFLPLMKSDREPGGYERLVVPSPAIQSGSQSLYDLLTQCKAGKPPVPIDDAQATWLYDQCHSADAIVTLARD